jgi:hypothetical protein
MFHERPQKNFAVADYVDGAINVIACWVDSDEAGAAEPRRHRFAA